MHNLLEPDVNQAHPRHDVNEMHKWHGCVTIGQLASIMEITRGYVDVSDRLSLS